MNNSEISTGNTEIKSNLKELRAKRLARRQEVFQQTKQVDNTTSGKAAGIWADYKNYGAKRDSILTPPSKKEIEETSPYMYGLRSATLGAIE